MKNETPDNYIERQPEDDGPQREDACMVCDKIVCECSPEQPCLQGSPIWGDDE